MLRRAFLTLLLAIASATVLHADALLGKNIYLPYLGFLTLPSGDFSRLPPGSGSVSTRHYYVNDFRPFLDISTEALEAGEPRILNADYEAYTAELGLTVGLSNRARAGIDVRLHALYGGFLDGWIEGFHSLFGLPNSYRHYFPQDAIRIDMSTADGTIRRIAEPTLRLGEIDLRTQVLLVERRRANLAGIAAISIPVPDPSRIVSSGTADLGLGFAGTIAWTPRISNHADLGLVVPLASATPEPRFPRAMLNALVGVAWGFAARVEAVADLRIATPPYWLDHRYVHPIFGTYRMYSLPQTNLTVGVRARTDVGTIEAYVEEDFLSWEGADIVVGARWSRVLGPAR